MRPLLPAFFDVIFLAFAQRLVLFVTALGHVPPLVRFQEKHSTLPTMYEDSVNLFVRQYEFFTPIYFSFSPSIRQFLLGGQ
jgi:hypothetical protein